MLSLQVNSKLPFERLSSFEMILFLIISALISVSVIIYCINEVQLAAIDDTLRKALAEMTRLRRFEYHLFVYLPFKRNPWRNFLNNYQHLSLLSRDNSLLYPLNIVISFETPPPFEKGLERTENRDESKAP